MRDHRAVIIELARQNEWKRGVEVGIGSGLLFASLLALGIDMIGVDIGRRADRRATVERLGGKVLWMPSTEAARHVADGWADFIFIDAAHSYQAVKADIAAWLPKLKPQGWFGGHDYHPAHPGVMRAVDEEFPFRRELEGWIWAAI